MTETSTFSPDWISPPGDTIEDILEERGWSKAELAQRAGFTKKHVNELVKGRAPISADAAERLSRVLGSTPDFWLVRDAQYQAALVRRRAIEAAKDHATWLEDLPLRWMRQQCLVESLHHKGAQVVECLRFFGVASVDAWHNQYEAPLAAFRASKRFESKLGSVAAWLREGERRASGMRCQPFKKRGFRSTLVELRSLTGETDPDVFVPRLLSLCAEHGVAVVFVPAPPGCPASGATRWLAPDKAMLLLSLRYRANDHLWFTLFHEAGHLLLHGKKLMFLEGVDGLDKQQEEEADRFARDLLIPPAEARRLAALSSSGRVSKDQVRAFAEEMGVAPGIVVGRMQFEEWLPWTHMNDLKVRYSDDLKVRSAS
jgi:addiction module HigA family antidote